MSVDEKRVYEYICRHFLACCSKDALGAETTVIGQMGTETFICRGLMVLERNYLEIFTDEKWSDKQIPLLEEGKSYTPSSCEMNIGKTTARSLITEPELISIMDATGIGTDATIAQHIDTIQ